MIRSDRTLYKLVIEKDDPVRTQCLPGKWMAKGRYPQCHPSEPPPYSMEREETRLGKGDLIWAFHTP
jgi:hypothetical protein